MKNSLSKRILALTLTLLTLAAVLAVSGCGQNKTVHKPVITCTDENGEVCAEMDEGMFAYFASEQKTMYLSSLLGDAFTQYATKYDVEDFWSHVDSEGEVTLGEYVYDVAIVREAKNLLLSVYLFDKVYGLECPAEVQTNIDTLIANLQKALGSKQAFDNYLLTYGTNEEGVRRLEEYQYKKTLLEKCLYDDDGLTPINDDDVKYYFRDNYAIVKHIVVNTAYATNDDGTRRELTDEEKAEKEELVKSIEARIAAGEDFDALCEEYKDGDPNGYSAYPHGYFVTDDETFVAEFKNAALEMQPGEVRTVATQYGTHIMKKYPMDENLYNAYDDIYQNIKNVIQAMLFNNMLDSVSDRLTVDEDIIASYDIIKIPLLLG